ncbi:MAG: two-component system, response regulator PdtaR [Sphingomonadales bacterium]|jgi:DNA-binding response OmpR family regulator|nr:two-component system, response regulator PdtaR [Sphingomonadales bacterium]
MRALIIEPQIFTSFMIEDALRDAGYTSIEMATTEEEAVASAEADPPDLVTAAVQLDRGSGISAVERIRSKLKVPVLFITQQIKQVKARDPLASIVKKPFAAAHLPPAIAAARAGG